MKIFKPVHCKAYLKKESDGISLVCTKRTKFGDFGVSELPAEGNNWDEYEDIKVTAIQTIYENGKWVTKDIKDLSSFEGETVNKRYRKRVEEDFDGFLVGITNITTTGEIGTDYDEYVYNMNGDMRGILHLTKTTHQEKVGVVYFKNNAKRYVPLSDMEEIK